MLQNVMPPMIDTELRPRKLSLKKYATPKPRAAATTSLGISTTMPVLMAPGVDLKLMPAPTNSKIAATMVLEPPRQAAVKKPPISKTCGQKVLSKRPTIIG